jgi:hypothetical protein
MPLRITSKYEAELIAKVFSNYEPMLETLKSCLNLFQRYNRGTLQSPNYEMEHKLEQLIKQAETPKT